MAAVTLAQTSTTSDTKKFQVISVTGNQLVVRLPEGTRELTVPDDFRFNVDGKMLSVHELKAGMSGSATITTKTTVTPVTVTEVKNGTVMQASGASVIVRTDQGIKMFTQGDLDKRGIKVMKDGKVAELSDLHANDKLTAVFITSKPPRVVTEKEVAATLAQSGGGAGAGAGAGAGGGAGAPAAAAKPTAGSGGSTAAAAPSAAASAGTAGAPARKLPKTASPLPLLGLAGLASLLAGLGLTVRRRRTAR
jgi:LPXTG-motif cell wall-anchored protein